ncbi:MAG: xylose isomerase [Deltaproteobacteria bacterium]|nr:xylose isomerase [Deltaproteobacteria bacterium]
MSDPYWPDVECIPYRGPDCEDALAYHYYDADHILLGQSMRDHLRVAVCYWHSLCWPGDDVFGDGTFARPWHGGGAPMELAERKLAVAFELFSKLDVPFFTFHDRDLAPEGKSHVETRTQLDHMLELAEVEMARTGVGLLWGTANLFGHPRYAAGAATNPDPEVFAVAAHQVLHALEATHRLGGANYVLWGGREGYDTLLNTDMRRELDQLGRFMQLVVEHKHRIGFQGTLLIEPKPMEPTKHQYDFDSAAVHAFLAQNGLEEEIKLNIEVNHATLAGHSFQHEIEYAIANDLFGSVDLNRGDPQLGWDTDQFPCDVGEATLALHAILRAGGLGSGGFNFDAKLRRQSIAPDDLLHAHIGGIDTLARGLRSAVCLLEDGVLEGCTLERYRGWEAQLGHDILSGALDLARLADLVEQQGLDPQPVSGRQEQIENQISRYLR